MSTRSIPRRPVAPSQQQSKAASITSASSMYSASPGLSRSESNSTKDSLSGVDSDFGPTLPSPPKDSGRHYLPQTPKSRLATSGFDASPPRPEIWKRRSVKSDRNIVVEELKLQRSNGSTTSPPPAVASHLPRSLQGRKPVPVRPAPPQPKSSGMGNKLSKAKDKNKVVSPESSENVQPQVYSTLNRVPTPEYLKSGKRLQTMNPLSPASPETPPNELPPVVPQKSDSRSTSSHTLVSEPILVNTANRPNLLTSDSRDTSENLTITSEPKVMRSPQPQEAYASKILTPKPSPPAEADKTSHLALPSPTKNLNIRFPRPSTPATPGTVIQGPELEIVHFECYQNHQLMRNSRNALCPTACMICRKKELGPRWRCAWCCLSACGACMQVLTSIPGNDLRTCLDTLAQKGHQRQEQQQGLGDSIVW